MSILTTELQKRKIPTLPQNWDRKKVLDEMQKIQYGYLPPPPLEVKGIDRAPAADCFNGTATYKKVDINCRLSTEDFHGMKTVPELGDTFIFDIDCYIPKKPSTKLPAIIAMNDREAFDFGTCPADYLCEQGFAVFNLRYRKIANDPVNPNGLTQFEERGLDNFYYGTHLTNLISHGIGRRKAHAPGVIALWAWGYSRVIDYVHTLDFIDHSNIIGAGHSRIGKTVLLAGAMDERFACVFPNASCAGGVSLNHGCEMETLGSLVGLYPNSDLWFCDYAKNFAGENYLDTDGQPFDQHQLVACIAPRKLYVGNAVDDVYCEANSEYLALVAANAGFIHPDRLPVTGDKFHEGNIGYHLREGGHAFTLEDWKMFVEFHK